MKAETSFFSPFYPTYLYEPYSTQFNIHKDFRKISNSPFFVTQNSMGTGDPVPSHLNVKDFSYPVSPKTVWQMIEDYSDLVNLVPLQKYGSRKKTFNASRENGKMDFYGSYSHPTKKYKEYRAAALKKYEVQKYPSNEGLANNEAREKLVNHLKYEWDGKTKIGIKGLVNFMAQTRIAASYGLLQMLYGTAISEVNYPNNPNITPEGLNEITNIHYAMKKLENHLNKLLSLEGKNNNWSLGLEKSYKEYIWQPWNKNYKEYPDKVYTHVSLFKPRSN